METHTDSEASIKAPGHPETNQQKWNLFIGDEPYGFVHASRDAVAHACSVAPAPPEIATSIAASGPTWTDPLGTMLQPSAGMYPALLGLLGFEMS